jgi:hypothetical protein
MRSPERRNAGLELIDMARGGHARSGPPPDPNSERSDLRGIKFTALPSEGYSGPVPDFPLPRRLAYFVTEKVRTLDEDTTEMVADREAELWAWAWSQPQAWAWSQASESWRVPTIAMWVRTYVLCESSEATAADKGSLHRFQDQIGLSPAGLKENGWAIAKDEVGAKRAESKPAPSKAAPKRRMRVVSGGSA